MPSNRVRVDYALKVIPKTRPSSGPSTSIAPIKAKKPRFFIAAILATLVLFALGVSLVVRVATSDTNSGPTHSASNPTQANNNPQTNQYSQVPVSPLGDGNTVNQIPVSPLGNESGQMASGQVVNNVPQQPAPVPTATPIPPPSTGNLQVSVNHSDRSPGTGIWIRLHDATGRDINQILVDGSGNVVFNNLNPGTYSISQPYGGLLGAPLSASQGWEQTNIGVVAGQTTEVNLFGGSVNVITNVSNCDTNGVCVSQNKPYGPSASFCLSQNGLRATCVATDKPAEFLPGTYNLHIDHGANGEDIPVTVNIVAFQQTKIVCTIYVSVSGNKPPTCN